MTAYLHKYQCQTGVLVLQEFGSLQEVTVERLKHDCVNTDPDLEIVAVASVSEEHLRESHSRYFTAV